MTSTKAVDRMMTALWANMALHGVTSADGVRIEVEGTGGGCEALTVTLPGYVVAIHDGDAQQPTGGDDDVAVLYTALQWAGEADHSTDRDGYVDIWDDASPANVAAKVAALITPAPWEDPLADTLPETTMLTTHNLATDLQSALGLSDSTANAVAPLATDLGSDDALSQWSVQVSPRAVLILTGACGVLWSALYIEGGETQVLEIRGRERVIRDLISGL